MPDSVLATAHSLRTLVAESFPSPTATATPAPHPHPLSASPAPSSLPALRAALSSHLSSLRSSLATFSTLALPPSASAQDPTASATGKRETDKYLTLLRDSAQHQAALLAHRTAATAHLATHRDNDDAWPVRVPFTRSRGAVLEALEGVAKELALVAFRDGDGGEGGAEGTAAEQSTKPVTLSVGGKVMVVDFEVRGGAADASAGEGGATVERVKVAYVVDGTDRVCDPAAQKLHALLSGPCDNEQERWKGVRRVLRQLGELDAETERSGRDCFTLLTESLVEELGGALGGAQSAAGAEEGQGPDLPALLPPSPTSLHPTLHLYSTPLASLLSPSPSSSPASTKPPGVYTATISLDLSAPPGAGEAEDRDAPRFVAVLDPPVPLSRATGREICEALGLRGSRDLVRDEGEEEQEGEEADEGWWSAVCGHERARGGRAEGDFAGGGVDEKCYRLTYPSLRPLSLHPVLPSPAAGTGARPAPLVATHLRFSRAAQLVAALGVLRRQVRANEVVWSLLRERERGREWERGESEGGDAEGKGRRRKKRRKVAAVEREDQGKTMTLEELFAPPTAPSALPITLHPSRGSSVGGGGGVLLSFPFPPLSSPTTQHLLGLPLSLSLSPAAAYRAQLALPPGVVAHLGGAERVEALERRVERVLEATGEAGLGMREVLRALETAGEGQ